MVDTGVPRSIKVINIRNIFMSSGRTLSSRGAAQAGPGSCLACGHSDQGPGLAYGLVERNAHTKGGPYILPYCCGFPWTFSEPRKPVRTAGGEDAGAFIAKIVYDGGWSRGRSAAVPATLLALSATPNIILTSRSRSC
jgi:hypothetical protein